jgi:large subunit ribosomal protein L13
MHVIDASNSVVGRLASLVAERALKGEEFVIVNAEKAIVVGKPSAVLERYLRRAERQAKGNPLKGPKNYKRPDNLLRQAIKGMLPAKKPRGRMAIKRIRVYVGVPKELEGKKLEKVEEAQYNGKEKYMTLAEISKFI